MGRLASNPTTPSARSTRPRAQQLPHRIEIELLGGFALSVGPDGGTLRLSVAQQRVLAFLALSDRPAARRKLAFVLWPALPDDRARHALRTALYRLNQAAPGIVDGSCDRLALAERVWCDVRILLEWTNGMIGRGTPADTDRPAVAFAELLPHLDDDWVVIERERVRQRVLHAYEAWSGALVGEGRHAEAVEAALAAVGIDPLRESATRALLLAHLAEGNTAEAMRHYDRFAERLHAELAIAPTSALTAILHRNR
jgi:DNA-binding SARP family transcriptional activator